MNIEEAIVLLINLKNGTNTQEYGNHFDKYDTAIETLLTAYEKEKEKNKELERNIILESKAFVLGINEEIEAVNKKWEDKIKAKIEELDKEIENCEFECNRCILDNQCISFKEKEYLQSLLEEKEENIWTKKKN